MPVAEYVEHTLLDLLQGLFQGLLNNPGAALQNRLRLLAISRAKRQRKQDLLSSKSESLVQAPEAVVEGAVAAGGPVQPACLSRVARR